MKLTDVKRVLQETTIEEYNNTKIRLSPIDKFQVFYKVCQNLLEEGTITQAQFNRWTTVY